MTPISDDTRAAMHKAIIGIIGPGFTDETYQRNRLIDAVLELADIEARVDSMKRAAESYRDERDAARTKVRAVELLHVWTNEDGRRFVFADDLAVALQIPGAAPRGESILEEGRRLASEREDLIVAGVDPAELLVPLAPREIEEAGPDA